MEKLTKVILNELNEWDLSCSEESTLKLELAKALTNVVKNCNLQNVVGSALENGDKEHYEALKDCCNQLLDAVDVKTTPVRSVMGLRILLNRR